MAAASVSARPPSTTSRPNPPSVHTTATSTSPSPSLSSKRPPSASHASAQPNGTTAPSTTPRNALRRRESQRGSAARNNRGSFMDAKKTLNEPYVRTTDHILHKFRGNRPSLVLHLHPTHFRFEQQDGSFGYNSPMKAMLEHLKAQTIPHEFLEELLHANVPFYDGCLIVEVHDHKSGPAATRNSASDTVGDSNSIPFSIHNYKEWLTPSPHVAYPSQAQTNGAAQKTKEATTNTSDKVKEQVASAPSKKSSPVFTTVLFPTPLARHKELMLLATTPVPDQRGGRRQTSISGRDSGNSNATNPPTPLSSIPTTPGGSRGGPPSKRRMILEEKDIYSFEGDVLRATEPPLFLEPAESFDGVLLALKTLKDPLHNHLPSRSRARKRTTAELAADEAQAAEDERMALLMDGRLHPSHSAPGAGSNATTADGHNAAKDFDPNFARFKALEDIKRRLDEENRRKKEEDMQQQQKKKEQQEAEQQRMREAEEARGQQQQIQIMRQRQAAMQQQAGMRGGQLPPHMMQNPHLQQVSQGQHSSPVMRNHTPQNSSPLSASVINNNPQAGIPHTASMPSQIQGPGSPPRPSSAMQGHPAMANQMARQVSQQHSQSGQSRSGTPQMATSTPHMGQSMPARHMTPQPGLNHGSPVSNGAMATPMMPQSMPNNPQMNGGQMAQTPQNAQQAAQMIARRNQFLAQQQRAAHMQSQGSPPNAGQFPNQQISPQQMQMLQMQQQRSQQQQQQQQQQQPNGQFNPNMQQIMQNMPQGLTPQQQQQFRMQQEQRQRIAMQQQANLQGQTQNAQHPQGTPGPGMPNGVSMAPSGSQGSAQSPFMPQQMNQMQQQGQGGQQMNPQQNAHFAAQQQQQARNQMIQQHQQMYYKQLRDRNGGQLPPNHEELFAQYRQQRAMAAGQAQMHQGQGPPPGSAGGQQVPGAMMNAQQFQQHRQMVNMQRQRQQLLIQQQQQQRSQMQQQQQGQQGRMGGQGSPG